MTCLCNVMSYKKSETEIMYSVLIVGAGYLGGAAARYFHAKKQKVTAIVRSEESRAALEREGITALAMDLTRPETIPALPKAHFIVMALAPGSRDAETYRAVYVDAAANFLKAIQPNPKPNLLLYISSSGVWPDANGACINEGVVPAPDSERSRILLEAEAQILRADLPSAVLRLSGIYGPGRNRVEEVTRGEFKAETGDRYLNLIHVEDAVRAIPVLFNLAKDKQIYIGSDDQPVLRSEFYAWLQQRLGRPFPASAPMPGQPGGKCLDNAKLKALGFSFLYPSFREGYEAILFGKD